MLIRNAAETTYQLEFYLMSITVQNDAELELAKKYFETVTRNDQLATAQTPGQSESVRSKKNLFHRVLRLHR